MNFKTNIVENEGILISSLNYFYLRNRMEETNNETQTTIEKIKQELMIKRSMRKDNKLYSIDIQVFQDESHDLMTEFRKIQLESERAHQ